MLLREKDIKLTSYQQGDLQGIRQIIIIAIPETIQFIQNAFAGTTKSGCTTSTELGNILNPLAFGAGLEPILIKLIDALTHLGDQDSKVKSDPVTVLNTSL